MRHFAPALALSGLLLCPNGVVYAQAASAASPPVTAAAAAAAAAPVQLAPHADSVAAMLPFARAHRALTALRERADAVYADPKNKKPEVLAERREQFRGERAQLLKGQGLTEASYGALTQRISADDAARRAFDAALVTLSAK